MTNSWKITIRVNSLVMNPLTPLDGSCAGMLFEHGQEVDDISMAFFETHEDVMLASYPIFQTLTSFQLLARPSFERTLISEGYPDTMYLPSETGKGNVLIGSVYGSRSPGFHRGTGQTVVVPQKGKVQYYMTGDIDPIFSLLRERGAIGAWSGKGHGILLSNSKGEIGKIEKVQNLPLCGIFALDDQGRKILARPVPKELAVKLGIPPSEYSLMDGRCANPYNPSVARRFGYSSDIIAVPKFGFM